MTHIIQSLGRGILDMPQRPSEWVRGGRSPDHPIESPDTWRAVCGSALTPTSQMGNSRSRTVCFSYVRLPHTAAAGFKADLTMSMDLACRALQQPESYCRTVKPRAVGYSGNGSQVIGKTPRHVAAARTSVGERSAAWRLPVTRAHSQGVAGLTHSGEPRFSMLNSKGDMNTKVTPDRTAFVFLALLFFAVATSLPVTRANAAGLPLNFQPDINGWTTQDTGSCGYGACSSQNGNGDPTPFAEGVPRGPLVRIQSAKGHHSSTCQPPVSGSTQGWRVCVASPSTPIFHFASCTVCTSYSLERLSVAEFNADFKLSMRSLDHPRLIPVQRCPAARRIAGNEHAYPRRFFPSGLSGRALN